MIDGLKKIKLSKILVFFYSLILILFFSCENDLEEIKKVSEIPGSPEERTRDLELIYSDSGLLKIRLNAPLAESFYKPTHTIKFKEGVKVHFFNPDGSVKTVLTASYGEIYQNEGKMLARDSVIMKNFNRAQQMETDELIWNQTTQEVTSSKKVVVKTKGACFYGDGIITTSDFSEYQFIKPRGTLNLKN